MYDLFKYIDLFKEASEDLLEAHGVSALIIRNDGKVLGITRGKNTKDIGLPGGKVEPGEDPKEACKRELREETGLEATSLEKLFTGLDYKGRKSIIFLVKKYKGKPKDSKEGFVKWVDRKELYNGKYGELDKELFKFIDGKQSNWSR